MTAATAGFDSPERAGDVIVIDVASDVIIFDGTIVAVDAAGNANPASDTAGLRVQGRAENMVDNTGGAAGDKTVNVRRGVFGWTNSETDPVSKAEVGKIVYVDDDITICKTGGTNHLAAGLLLAIEGATVYVDTRLAPTAL